MIRPAPNHVALILIVVLASACTSTHQDAPDAPAETEGFESMRRVTDKLREVLHPYQESKNLLGETLALRTLAEDTDPDNEMARSMFEQTLATNESFLGNHHAALVHYDRQDSPPEKIADPDATPLAGFEHHDAVTALVQAARTRRAVFINEAHHVARHRALTRRLLPRLREIGFTHFAAETLLDLDGVAARGYPSAETGYYTLEPLYGDLVRVALDLGYKLVAYESLGPPAKREPGQAANLVQRAFQDPAARVFVHLGYAHNKEGPNSFGGVGAMAFHFQQRTGIDPLTIDQTRMSERSHPSFEHPVFRYVADTLAIDEPTVFVNAAGEFWHADKDLRDVSVFLPRTRYENGRPDWLRLGRERRPVVLPADVCGAADPCLVEARLVDEGEDAMPIDRVEVSSRRERPVLLLPDRAVMIQVLDAEKKVLRSWPHPGTG